jgi:probable phosphoglycerate mutase
MIETQMRMVRRLDGLRAGHPGQTVAVVSHGDPLRSVIAHYLGIALDHVARFEISPGSVSVVELHEWGNRLLCLNETGDLPI